LRLPAQLALGGILHVTSQITQLHRQSGLVEVRVLHGDVLHAHASHADLRRIFTRRLHAFDHRLQLPVSTLVASGSDLHERLEAVGVEHGGVRAAVDVQRRPSLAS
jgi:hypothetical protein